MEDYSEEGAVHAHPTGEVTESQLPELIQKGPDAEPRGADHLSQHPDASCELDGGLDFCTEHVCAKKPISARASG